MTQETTPGYEYQIRDVDEGHVGEWMAASRDDVIKYFDGDTDCMTKIENCASILGEGESLTMQFATLEVKLISLF